MKGQIEKGGAGVYRLRWYRGRVNGKRVYGSETVRGTKRQAEERLRRSLAARMRDTQSPPAYPRYPSISRPGRRARPRRSSGPVPFAAISRRSIAT